jgi:hypothetical protein
VPIRAEPFDEIELCHYPVRSIAQYAKKIAIGYLQYAANPDWDRGQGWHYIAPFRTLARAGLQALTDRMICDSRSYSLPKGGESRSDIEPQDRPLDYRGGALTFTPRRITGALEDVLRHAEKVAALVAENTRLVAAGEAARHEAKYLRSRAAQLELALLDAEERLCVQDRRLQSRTFRFLTWVYALLLALAAAPKRMVAGASAALSKRSR